MLSFPLKSPFLLTDSYKQFHWKQYPTDTQSIYSNFTARGTRLIGYNGVRNVGLTYFLNIMDMVFKKHFFDLDKESAVENFISGYQEFNLTKDTGFAHLVGELWDLQYLPLEIRGLDEGDFVPFRVPLITIRNTHPRMYFLTNYIESWLSAEIWPMITTLTIACKYRSVFDYYAQRTSDNLFMVNFQGHDFSFRGLRCAEDCAKTGGVFAFAFNGSDNLLAIPWLQHHYKCGEQTPENLIVTSVPATEHSVTSSAGKEGELDNLKRLLTEVHTSGIMSYVSDTYDFWNLVTSIIPKLKDVILAREGKLVVRPDSSPKTPVEIVCGDSSLADPFSPEYKGLILCLWEVFGGTENSKHFSVLDPHIGAIYGEAISPKVQEGMLRGLYEGGFDSTSCIMGLGSYGFVYNTRDTFGLAFKSTAREADNEWLSIYKDPVTDPGIKKSAVGLLQVVKENNQYVLIEGVSPKESFSDASELKVRYLNGKRLNQQSFTEIRDKARDFTNDLNRREYVGAVE